MPNFNIIKESEIEKTYRVERVKGDFDLSLEKNIETFQGNIDIENKEWKIGLIVGASGTGKTTIAKQLFDLDIESLEYKKKSVIDDMPKNKSVDEIIKMFYSVGFGSAPNWLKPYKVLSNGEKMRVDLANLLLSDNETIVFDEFTSVVDREIAKTSCIAINKALNNTEKKFIALSCHYDVKEWLEPDWIFDTNEMLFFSEKIKGKKEFLVLKNVQEKSGESLGNITI